MMPSVNPGFAPFASLPPVVAPRRSLAALFLSPFRDVDDRPALKAAALKADREARQIVMSGAASQPLA